MNINSVGVFGAGSAALSTFASQSALTLAKATPSLASKFGSALLNIGTAAGTAALTGFIGNQFAPKQSKSSGNTIVLNPLPNQQQSGQPQTVQPNYYQQPGPYQQAPPPASTPDYTPILLALGGVAIIFLATQRRR